MCVCVWGGGGGGDKKHNVGFGNAHLDCCVHVMLSVNITCMLRGFSHL